MSNEDRQEIFKRSVDSAFRAVSRNGEIEIIHSAESGLVGENHVKLPHPAYDLNAKDIAIMRGTADSLALRVRHHNETIHERLQPQNETARDIFNALETARCEAIGSGEMHGVSENITAYLSDRFERMGLSKAASQEDIPLSEAMRMIAHEALTGQAAPQHAKTALNTWRSWIEKRSGGQLKGLRKYLYDQDSYSRAVQDLIENLHWLN